jgi:AraC-like DNA-binding protein
MNMPEKRNTPEEVIFNSSGISLFESHHSSMFYMKMGMWPFSKLCWVAMGEGFLETETLRLPIKMHDILFLPENVMHRFVDVPKAPLTLVGICWNENASRQNRIFEDLLVFFTREFPAMRPVYIETNIQRTNVQSRFRDLLKEYCSETPEKAAYLHAALSNLMITLLRHGKKHNLKAYRSKLENDLDDVVDHLNSNFDQQIKVEDLAGFCSVSRRRFGTLFKNRTGKTPVEYLTEKRIEFARERLLQTGNIAYAASESGFQDIAYFYRVFKKQCGITPKTFIKNCKVQRSENPGGS